MIECILNVGKMVHSGEERTVNYKVSIVIEQNEAGCFASPPRPRPVLQWDDHLSTAVVTEGRSSDDIVRADREGRW
jgi:hypothetical protein